MSHTLLSCVLLYTFTTPLAISPQHAVETVEVRLCWPERGATPRLDITRQVLIGDRSIGPTSTETFWLQPLSETPTPR